MDPTNYWGQVDLTQIPSVTGPLQAYQQAQQQGAARALAVAQTQRLQQQQAIGDAALKDALANPSAQTYQALAIARPEVFQSAKAAHDMLDTETQRSNVQNLGAVFGNLNAGQNDQAAALLKQYGDAAKRAGKDASSYDALQSLISTDPTKAKVLAGTMLSTLAGPDKFAEAYGQMGKEGREQAAFPTAQQQAAANLAKTTAETDQITNPRPETQSAGLGPDGQPIFFNKNAPPPANSGAALSANNGALNGFVQQIIQSESGGNPTATNPGATGTGTATGAAQFLKGTWLPLMQQLHPELTQGKTEQQVLDLRNNPNLTAEATAAYAQQNAQALGSAGLPVNGATLALAHKLGPGGAQAVLNASPDAKLSTVLSPEAIAANPSLGNQRAGAYAQNLAKRFGTTAIDTSPGDPNATGEDFLKTLPPARARMIKAIANGDSAMPPAVGRNPAQSQLLMQQVLQYDPTASAINLPARMAVRKDFTAGKSAASIKALNTLAGHLEELDQSIDGLRNTNFDWFNAPAQALGKAAGDPATLKAVARFNGWIGPVATELTNVLRGSGGAESDIQNWMKQLKTANSPIALHQTVQDIVRAAQSRLGALQDTYNSGMGRTQDPLPFLRPSTQQVFDRLAGNGSQQASSAPPPQAVAMLKANPALGPQFDAKYGAGASQQYTGR